MAEINISIGESRDAMAARFVAAWKRAERGEVATERHLSFDSFETAAKVLTPKRLALLRGLNAEPATSVAALARRLGRDYRRVHADVQALLAAGLIEQPKASGPLTAPYDAIETRIAL